ncbi:stage II sporulation protein P [Moorella sp. Hama-1]|uniref:stage II sporulation protein P n=1 Tax=Moorella sp. Hama-1 TaxID=2138101 RepID=UPI000D64AAC1|nr:stage II sporulation protein P [Moorella sp. Hama-1]MDN5361371.1 stage sporulation protein [Moorella sp. (in: firmicutes)]BCV21487.1 stage II sporulation protein P [Moorella sp. Hama-1]
MSKISRSIRIWGGLGLLVLALVMLGVASLRNQDQAPAARVFSLAELLPGNHTTGQYSVLVDEQGRVLDMMARKVYIHDEFISADNHRYRVIRIEGNRGICREIGIEQISLNEEEAPALAGQPAPAGSATPAQAGSQIIGVYHSHDDESYVPSDGTESIPGNGGILKVGSAFSDRLRSLGLTVIHDTTSHAPHDDGSYRRSRRTALSLLQKGAAALFDIHRDGVPDPTFYRRTINGQDVTMVRLVVGRENQNMGANLDYAKRLKAAADARYPGLIRGIFIGAGSYNQDLTPRAMLLEVGTHTNTRQEAERGAALFADVVPPVLGFAATPTAARTPSTAADWKGVFFVLLAFVLGGGIFLLISAGSWEKAVARLKQFTSIEWVNLLGWRRASKPLVNKGLKGNAGKEKETEEMDEEGGAVRPLAKPYANLETNDERADWQKD